MGTAADKLTYLQETKEAIRKAIEAQGDCGRGAPISSICGIYHAPHPAECFGGIGR